MDFWDILPYFYAKAREVKDLKNFKTEIILIKFRSYVLSNSEGRVKVFQDICMKYPRMTGLWLGPAIVYVLVNDPSLIKEVLLSPKCLDKPFLYGFFRLGSGLITANCK